MSESIQILQRAVCVIAKQVNPRKIPRMVVVFDNAGVRMFSMEIPEGMCEAVASPTVVESLPVLAPPGWSFSERGAAFDGKPVAVSTSRIKLLRVLVEADRPHSGKELAKLAFGDGAIEDNAQWHIRKLRAELAAAFPDFEGEIIPGEGGYRLILR